MAEALRRAAPAQCVVLGGGGHARVVIDCLLSAGTQPRAVLDADAALWGTEIAGVKVLGDDAKLAELDPAVRLFVIGVGAVRDTELRRRLFEAASAQGLSPLTVCHPSAVVSTSAVLDDGAQILPGAIVNAGARIGSNAIVNSGAIVEHDCTVGDHAHIATGARLGGGVHVGTGAMVGIGATVRQGTGIGDGAFVGAGAVVVKDVAPGVTVTGVPAEPREAGA